MGVATGFEVMRLSRTAFAGVTSEGMRPGAVRSLTYQELSELKKTYGVPRSIPGEIEPNLSTTPLRAPWRAKRGEHDASAPKPEPRGDRRSAVENCVTHATRSRVERRARDASLRNGRARKARARRHGRLRRSIRARVERLCGPHPRERHTTRRSWRRKARAYAHHGHGRRHRSRRRQLPIIEGRPTATAQTEQAARR